MLLDGTDGMLAIPSARPPLRWCGSDLHMTMCRVSGGIRMYIAPRHWGSCATGGCFVGCFIMNGIHSQFSESGAVLLCPSLARIKNFCRANAMPCMAASLPVSQNHCDTEKLWVHWQHSLDLLGSQARSSGLSGPKGTEFETALERDPDPIDSILWGSGGK